MDKHDPVNHPAHYTQYPHEVIELTEQLGFCLGNAVKYILRADYKGHKSEDLKKAAWYLRHILDRQREDKAVLIKEIHGWYSGIWEAGLGELAASYGNDFAANIVKHCVGINAYALERQLAVLELEAAKAEIEELKSELKDKEDEALLESLHKAGHALRGWGDIPALAPKYTLDDRSPSWTGIDVYCGGK